MRVIRILGIFLMFLGIGLKLAGFTGYTICFIAGAILILLPRFYQVFARSRQH